MPARGPAGDDDRPLDAVLAGLGVEPVERAFQLVGDLRQGRLRRQRIAAQSRRPTTGQRTLGVAVEPPRSISRAYDSRREPCRPQHAGDTAIASTSKGAPSRASFGTSKVVLAEALRH